MAQARREAICFALFVLVTGGSAVPAAAHAPLVRDLARSADGRTVLALPGFGIVVQREPGGPFAYACNALLEMGGATAPAAVAFGADGALRVVEDAALQVRSPEGCRLEDRVVLEGPVTGLAVVPSMPERIHLSLRGAGGSSSLLRSTDGGASFTAMPMDRDVALAHAARSGGVDTLWGVEADRERRDVALLRSSVPSLDWTEVTRVRFFGGFARDRGTDVWWIGDEAGGLRRTSDGGARFEVVQPALATACLHHDGRELWACSPGTPAMPAVLRSDDGGDRFEPVLALAEVDRLLECPETDVRTRCAAAWAEWQSDVLGMPPGRAPQPAAGVDPPADGGPGNDGGAPDAARRGGTADASAPRAGGAPATGGCTTAPVRGRGGPSCALVAASVWLYTRRRTPLPRFAGSPRG